VDLPHFKLRILIVLAVRFDCGRPPQDTNAPAAFAAARRDKRSTTLCTAGSFAPIAKQAPQHHSQKGHHVMQILNFRIGTKIALMSLMSILLVGLTMAAATYSNRQIRAADEKAELEQSIAQDVAAIDVAFMKVRLTMRDVRFAATASDLAAADTLAAQQDVIDKLIARASAKFTLQENRERLQKIHAAIRDYIDVTRTELLPIKSALLETSDASNAAILNTKLDQLRKERLKPEPAMVLLGEIGQVAARLAADAAASAKDTLAFAEFSALALGAAIVVILIGSAVLGAWSIARPMRALVPPLQAMADGDFNVRIPFSDRGDEVGLIAAAAQSLVDRLGAALGNIKLATSEVTTASIEIASGTTDLSQRTEEQAASLEETSASMTEMSSTVRRNAESANEANAFATDTCTAVENAGMVVNEAVGVMADVERSSQRISDIIGVIDEIARQTNLLALNAAVEAARAGEAGRGFAVVATEVRSLAQRSSQAAHDIKDLITSSGEQIQSGVDLVKKAGHALGSVVEKINVVAAKVAEIASASAEQAVGIEEVGRALSQMDDVTQQNAALVEENAATAKALEDNARLMAERVATFRVGNIAGVTDTAGNPPATAPAHRGLQAWSKPKATGTRTSGTKPAGTKTIVGAASAATARGGTANLVSASVAATQEKLDAAIDKHAEWKIKLRSAMSKHEALDTPTIAKDNCCQLGQWLYGDGRLKFGNKPEFDSLIALHKAFHTEAAKVSQLINDRKYSEADRALAEGSRYNDASQAVRGAIIALKKAVAA
jgi:methyl-accepting chemotaxis protein